MVLCRTEHSNNYLHACMVLHLVYILIQTRLTTLSPPYADHIKDYFFLLSLTRWELKNSLLARTVVKSAKQTLITIILCKYSTLHHIALKAWNCKIAKNCKKCQHLHSSRPWGRQWNERLFPDVTFSSQRSPDFCLQQIIPEQHSQFWAAPAWFIVPELQTRVFRKMNKTALQLSCSWLAHRIPRERVSPWNGLRKKEKNQKCTISNVLLLCNFWKH